MKLDIGGYAKDIRESVGTITAAEAAGYDGAWVAETQIDALMTEVAGEVADGFLCHGFSTERYVREVTLPALARGRAKAGKIMEGFEISGPAFMATGTSEEEITAAIAAVKQQISFYGSTPTYRTPEDVPAELNRRYGDIAHRMTLTVPYQSNPDRWAGFFDALRIADRGL